LCPSSLLFSIELADGINNFSAEIRHGLAQRGHGGVGGWILCLPRQARLFNGDRLLAAIIYESPTCRSGNDFAISS